MAAPVDQRIAVPVDDPNADTEWNDILRQHGIIPEKPPSPTPMIEEALAEGRRLAHEGRLEAKDLDELDALEDEEADEDFLNAYRQQRMQEIRALQKTAVHGSVYPLTKPEYSREVTEASQQNADQGGTFVFVNLIAASGSGGGGGSSSISGVESRVLSELWRQAAVEFGELKFCEMRADQAIEGYPDRNCPTILVYRNGEVVKQVVTLALIGGVRMTLRDLDALLVEVGAVPDTDMRVLKRRRAAEEAEDERLAAGSSSGAGKSIRGSLAKKAADGDDDDWD